jgi:hypothetical protein
MFRQSRKYTALSIIGNLDIFPLISPSDIFPLISPSNIFPFDLTEWYCYLWSHRVIFFLWSHWVIFFLWSHRVIFFLWSHRVTFFFDLTEWYFSFDLTEWYFQYQRTDSYTENYHYLFNRCSLVSSTNKTDRHHVTEILLKVVLNTITLTLLNISHF